MFFLVWSDNNPHLRIRFAFVNWAIGLGCVALFALDLFVTRNQILPEFALYPASFKAGAPALGWPPLGQLVTYMFLHATPLHLAANMFYLWIFGDNVEDALGHRRYLLFVLMAGIIAGLAQAALGPPVDAGLPVVGLSGALMGVMAGYLVLYPDAKVNALLLGRNVRALPAWLVIGAYIGFDILSATLGASNGTAVMAHLGGAAAGAFLIGVLRPDDLRLQAEAGSALPAHRPGAGGQALVSSLLLAGLLASLVWRLG